MLNIVLKFLVVDPPLGIERRRDGRDDAVKEHIQPISL